MKNIGRERHQLVKNLARQDRKRPKMDSRRVGVNTFGAGGLAFFIVGVAVAVAGNAFDVHLPLGRVILFFILAPIVVAAITRTIIWIFWDVVESS